jgi:ubiquinone/menaquinone biosynthesis C-methylase UbiE
VTTGAARETRVFYTTLYREGGASFERIANTLARERGTATAPARAVAVESKVALVAELAELVRNGTELAEFHFVGHSGMYGPMFGTTAWPEQFSPHEWRALRIPWSEGAEAYFHACRTARWFAPFFARTQGVTAHGFHGYTSFSSERARFAPEWKLLGEPGGARPLYAIAIDGRKSHGLVGSLRKYGGIAKPEVMKRFTPEPIGARASYDDVAELYDGVFDDIRVRRDEWRFLEARVPEGSRVLDLGCGNGALLQALAPRIASGVGVDASAAMIDRARRRLAPHGHIGAVVVTEPKLPFPDASFDVIVSLLSFRYLDWDPILREIHRVARPGARLLVVDMVASPATLRELPRLAFDKVRTRLGELSRPAYRERLHAMVQRDAWHAMLEYNPIRAEHEYRWYLGSRFPRGTMSLLNVGGSSKVLGFESGPIDDGRLVPISYP